MAGLKGWHRLGRFQTAGAKSFREIGDQATDLPQEVLARLGGTPRPLLRRIAAPSEKRIRTLIQALDAAALDEIIGGWLRGVADAGRLEPLLAAIDGKWLRGVGDGQVKLFAAMLHEKKVMIAQHRIPDETTETTQVKELLGPVDLDNAVVTADPGPRPARNRGIHCRAGKRRRPGWRGLTPTGPIRRCLLPDRDGARRMGGKRQS